MTKKMKTYRLATVPPQEHPFKKIEVVDCLGQISTPGVDYELILCDDKTYTLQQIAACVKEGKICFRKPPNNMIPITPLLALLILEDRMEVNPDQRYLNAYKLISDTLDEFNETYPEYAEMNRAAQAIEELREKAYSVS